MTTSEIQTQIEFHEKQIRLLEMAKRAIEQTQSIELDAAKVSAADLFRSAFRMKERANVRRAIAKRVLRYYHNISVLNYEGA